MLNQVLTSRNKNLISPVKTYTNSKKRRFFYARKATGDKNCLIDNRNLRIGKKNNLWKGGIAEYPNHYLMKKNRLIILMQNPKCEFCGKPATQIHHKNHNKSDHRLSNLQSVCCKCHPRPKIHKTQNTIKYGMNLREIAFKIGYSYGKVYEWEKQGILGSIIISNPGLIFPRLGDSCLQNRKDAYPFLSSSGVYN